MKRTFGVVLAALLVFVAGCSMMGQSKAPSLVGTWAGEMPGMGDITMTFRDDMTVDVAFSGNMEMEMTGKYTVDYSADPMTLDQYDFEDSMMGDMKYLSIVKFVDANTIMMAGNPDTQGGRPDNFDFQAMELKRQ